MIKRYGLFYVLLTFYMMFGTINSDVTEVIWDDLDDIIYYEGKLYYPSDKLKHPITPIDNNSSHENNSNNGKNNKLPENKFNNPEKHGELATGAALWVCIFMILLLTIGSGLFSGLTVGYLSIDDLALELRFKNGSDLEKNHAQKVLPILSKRHWLLVTLLLMNAACMEALPIFFQKIVPEFIAIILSVSLVLLFGEIIPQAYCTGPDQVKIAALIAPFTNALMWFTYPISFPISLLLDRLLGEHGKSRFINEDLKTLIELHTHKALDKLHIFEHHEDNFNEQIKENDLYSNSNYNNSSKFGLIDEQANLMISALEMQEKKVIELMIPIRNTFMIDYDDILDKFKLNLILDKGYSRIPVYSNHNKNDIVGLLRIKQLIGVDFDQNKSLRQLGIQLGKPIVISPKTSVFDLLREFRKGKSHMAFITEQVEDWQNKFGLNRSNSIQRNYAGILAGSFTNSSFRNESILGDRNDESNVYLYDCKDSVTNDALNAITSSKKIQKNINILGIITLEDVIEKMINLEILDEDDYEKVLKKRNLKTNRGGGGLKKASYIGSRVEKNKYLERDIASSSIREESSQMDSLLNESINNRKSIKDLFIKKGLNVTITRDSIENNKDPLI